MLFMAGVRTAASNIFPRLDDCLVYYGLSVCVVVGLVSIYCVYRFDGW